MSDKMKKDNRNRRRKINFYHRNWEIGVAEYRWGVQLLKDMEEKGT